MDRNLVQERTTVDKTLKRVPGKIIDFQNQLSRILMLGDSAAQNVNLISNTLSERARVTQQAKRLDV